MGADSAFQAGACEFDPRLTQIWLPWGRFKDGISCHRRQDECNYEILSNEEFKQARSFYVETKIISWFDKLTSGAQMLHARNYFQVYGNILEEFSEFVLYAAPENDNCEVSGGTRSAVMVARYYHIPTYNIRSKQQVEWFEDRWL